MDNWLYHGQWLGNSTIAWLIAGGAALAAYVVAHGAAKLLATHLRRLAERTGRSGFAIAAQVVAATYGWLLLLIAMAIALDFLHFAQPTPRAVHLATYALVGIQIALWISALLVGWLQRSSERADGRKANPVMVGVLTWAVRFVVWVTLVLALMAESGINITAFVASLGIGGVAVALALQNVLTDLFSSIAIGLDKPFEVGEFIAFGSDLGTVMRVGIKSTRIKSLSGEELAISNSDLLKNLLHNYTRMRERRVVFGFRLSFATPCEKVPEVVARVRGFVEEQPKTRFDRCHLRSFGDAGLEFELVYYVLDPGYNLYCDIQQHVNVRMLDAFSGMGVEFAVPVRRLHPVPSGDAPPMQLAGG